MTSSGTKPTRGSTAKGYRCSRIVIYEPPVEAATSRASYTQSENGKPKNLQIRPARSLHFITTDDPGSFKSTPMRKNIRSYVMQKFRQDQRFERDSAGRAKLEERSRSRPSAEAPEKPDDLPHHRKLKQFEVVLSSCEPTNFSDRFAYVDSLQSNNEEAPSPASPESVEAYYSHVNETFDPFGVLRNIGTPLDPFKVLPQLACGINTEALRYHCVAAFPSKVFYEEWIPKMVSSRHCYISSLCISAVHLDLNKGFAKDGTLTTLVKTESIHLVSEELKWPPKNREDAVSRTMTVAHLMLSESGIEDRLAIHEKGLWQILEQCGGLRYIMHAGSLGASLLSIFQLFAIWQEKMTIFKEKEFDRASLPLIINLNHVADSPVYCPQGDFSCMEQDTVFSEHSIDLINTMRDLTDLLVAQNDSSTDLRENLPASSASEVAAGARSSPFVETVYAIHEKIVNLPSGMDLASQNYVDWKYETLRITSLIFTIAIFHSVPMSEVNCIFQHPHYHRVSVEGYETSGTPHALTEMLRTALEKSNVDDLWGNYKGMIFWVASIGTAASRIKSNTSRATDEEQTRGIYLRRYFAMVSMRAHVPLVFESPEATLVMNERLLNALVALKNLQLVAAIEKGFYSATGIE